MSFSSNIQKILSSDNIIRKEGEFIIQQQLDLNFLSCLNNCCDILTNEIEDQKVRQFCATFIKNILSKEEYINKWESLDQNSRETLKTKILSCLASNSHEIRCATSLVIASICRIEVPKGNWNQIFEILSSTAQHTNDNYKKSSIITIGYIAQDLKRTDLNQDQINKLLFALTRNLDVNNNIEVFKCAITSFLNFLPFAKQNFQKIDEREILVRKIIELLSYNNLRDDLIEGLLKCLVEMASLYHSALNDKMSIITNITCKYMKSPNKEIAIQAIEFWNTLCKEELNENVLYVSNLYQDDLYLVIQYLLLNRNEAIEQQYSDEWLPIKSIQCLISLMSQCKNEIFIEKMLDFIGKYFHDINDMNRDSAYLAFGAILEYSGLSDEIVIVSISQILKELSNEKKKKVAETMTWCFHQICEFHSFCFDDQQLFDSTITIIYPLLQSFLPNKTILIQLLKSLELMIQFVSYKSYLTKHAAQLIQILMKLAYTPGSYDPNNNVAMICFYVINSLIDNAEDDIKDVVFQLLFDIFKLFQDSFSLQNFTSKEEQETYQGYLCTVISSSAVKYKMNDTQIFSVYDVIKKIFHARQSVFEEGIMAISSLSTNTETFPLIMKDFISFLVVGLKSIDSPSICKQSINSTDEIIQHIDAKVIPFLPTLMPLIFNILNDINCDRFLKLYCFLVLSDLFCLQSGEAYSYFNEVMHVTKNAMTAAISKPSPDDDSDVVEYFLKLREQLIELLICLSHFLQEYGKENELKEFTPNIIQFINLVCSEEYSPNKEIIDSAVGLICDLVQIFPDIVTSTLNRAVMSAMISKINRNSSEREIALLKWAGNVITKYNLI